MEHAKAPEDIARRRDRVREWVLKAREAVLSFQRPDGSFWRDSRRARDNDVKELSGTTTARSYMSLVYADRCCTLKPTDYQWRQEFAKYLAGLKITWGATVNLEINGSHDQDINNFELAHLADLIFAKSYLEKYAPQGTITAPALEDLPTRLQGHFNTLANEKWSGRFPMQGTDTGPHYFVNLHATRAHAILGIGPEWVSRSIEPLRGYCLSQCFYAQRGLPHRVDAIQLILAGVACALYDDNPPVELYEAVIDAIQELQQPGGNWPATHPVFLKGGKPWHITSHEMALCLTWLYHIPHITDVSRQKLLAMMELYFEQWVVRTYARAVYKFSGWYDDHHIDDNYVVGWATSIVCHFLANYHWVLSHEVNRLVIESLGLTDSAEHYRFDDTAPRRARFSAPSNAAPWSDLAPYSWDPNRTAATVTADIRKNWTDPSNEQTHTEEISRKIIAPILAVSNARPAKARCAGMLDGPPGTRKTSLVRQVAEALRWPLVTVPGSVILSAGWDGMEARATEVFRKLKLLANCVIFFDEYEEFFRSRGPDDDDTKPTEKLPHVDNRTIAAFMTSGMLPRLQDLHDEQRCVLFLATNFPETIDKAVRRAGRFDFKLTIDHPEPARVIEYMKDATTAVRQELAATPADTIDSIISAVEKEVNALAAKAAKSTAPKQPRFVIPFKRIEDVLRQAALAPADAETIARRVLDQPLDMDAPALSEIG